MKFFLLALVLSVSSFAKSNPVASGKLILPEKLTAQAAGIRTVFLTIKDPQAAAPMPCAAQKFTLTEDAKGEFLSFDLDSASLMLMSCSEIPKIFNLKAKLDKDGNAGPDGPGDIVGMANRVKRGSKGVKIQLDSAQP